MPEEDEGRHRGRLIRLAPPFWAVAWGLSLVFLLLALSLPEPPHRLEYLRIQNRQGMPLRVVVFFPQPAVYNQAPAAVLCQPFNNPPEYARLLALELVSDGFVVLTFDWRGRVVAENRQLLRADALEVLRADAGAAVAYLRGLSEVDAERIVIAGHSVGGTLAVEAAMADARIAAVASIGMEADVTASSPRNLLWALGLYDEFWALPRSGNITVGDFARGTARRLGVSPTADHFTEMQDRRIHGEVLEWFRRAVDLPPTSRRLWMEARALLLLLAGLVALLAALLTLRRIAVNRPRVLRATAALALLGVLLLTRAWGPHFLLAADAVLGLVFFALLAGFVCTREAEALERGWRSAARLGLALWASLFLTLVVNNIANYAQEPRYLLSLPEFALRHLLDGLYSYLVVHARPLLSSTYDPQALVPRLWVYVVLGLEVVAPGLLLGLVARLVGRRPRQAPPLRVLGVLLLLLALLAGVAWLRLEQGFLTGESARAALRFLLRFTVLPLFIFTLLWRWLRTL